jgi:hypothetical protein
MDFNDWFDVKNIDHVVAFEKMQITGCWARHFLPVDVTFKSGWLYITLTQLADAYIEHVKSLGE